jgi:TolB-like protein
MNDFFAELKRRRMYRVGAGYVVVAWAITQVIDVLSQVFNLSAWIGQTTIVMLVVGLPLVLIAQWLLDGRALAADPSAANSRRAIVDWLLFSSVAIIACLTVFWLMIPNNAVVVADSEDGRGAIAALPNSLAILPLENLSPDPENAYFAAGIHHDLLSHLAKISALKVISRTSVIGYRETTKNMREIGQELAVANVLEGGVRRAGNMLQINVDLIEALSR